MTYKNPENFDYVTVEGKSLPMGEEGPWNVVGIKTRRDGWDEYRDVTVIKGPFRTKQVASKWFDIYLEMYTKDAYFEKYVDGWLFEPLDSDN